MILDKFIRLFFGDARKRNFKRVKPVIEKINAFYEQFESLSDEEIRAKTPEFRERLENGENLDDLLPEAFATVKQACRRLCGQSWVAGGTELTWNMVPYDVQLCGGIYLHQGNIAEMATGEGKTLVAALPMYLNALPGKGAHLVTVNDYLARRDAEWIGKLYEFLGLSWGVILSEMDPPSRREAYNCDITYGTNNEFGFDYLRDNMTWHPDNLVQRGYHYAIVDEVDSVLIDEARTPLIISGQVDRSTHMFDQIKPLVFRLVQRQNQLVNDLMIEAEKTLGDAEGKEKTQADADRYEAGRLMLKCRMGSPKHKRLMKAISSDASVTRLIDKVESDYMLDKKIGELEEELYFAVDEKGHQINLTEKGRSTINPDNPELFMLTDVVTEFSAIEGEAALNDEEKAKKKEEALTAHEERSEMLHNISQMLRAYVLYEKDREYVIQDDKVKIVDEYTGRIMEGRRWSDGLHQAVEAKEGVSIQKETQTLATITLQNFFRMYSKLSGMTGTAETEAAEFSHTYGMNVAVIPTNRPLSRLDEDDLIYKTQREKYKAIIDEVTRLHTAGLPVLVGTTSVDVSEKLSHMLRRNKISHNVLNAKNHEGEAHVVAEAGKYGTVTIATNMAGRGTDIKIDQKVWDIERDDKEGIVPGLQIIGSERHESRRIDRQLRGRSGRQGDPGRSLFYVSLEDDLMRLFASERMASLIGKGMEEGEAIQHGMATNALNSAQKKIEGVNFERRKRTLEYDNVMNGQREEIYGMRRRALIASDKITEQIMEIAADALANEWAIYGEGVENQWASEDYLFWVRRCVPFVKLDDLPPFTEAGLDDCITEVLERCENAYAEKTEVLGQPLMNAMARVVILQVIDNNWRDHLLGIDELREGIFLRSYGQKDPLVEYQREASEMFQEMLTAIRKEIFEKVFRAAVVQETTEMGTSSRLVFVKEEGRQSAADTARSVTPQQPAQQQTSREGDAQTNQASRPPRQHQTPMRRDHPKIRPNDPCPCGSGKKYKKCCGAAANQMGGPQA